MADRDSPIYFRPGSDRESQLRVAKPARLDLEHAHKVLSRRMKKAPSFGAFVAIAASVGAEEMAGKVRLSADPDDEVRLRMARPLKQELLQRHEEAYRAANLPPADFGVYVVHAALRGARAMIASYASGFTRV